MTTRWDVEHAATATPMLPNRRYLLLLLATRCDHQTAVIPAKFSPSLTELVRMSGLARSTVCVHLAGLEATGWLVRKRPTPQEARTKHARTRYRLTVPKLVRSSNAPGPVNGSELVRSSNKAGPPTGRKDNRQPEPPAHPREEEVLQTITETLRELAPAMVQAHTREWAARVAEQIPGGRDRVRYVETVIRNDPAPYLPTPGPPRFRAPTRS